MRIINFWEWLSRIDPNNTQMILFGTGGLVWFVVENIRSSRNNRSEDIGSAEEQEEAVRRVKSTTADRETRDLSLEAVSAAFMAMKRAESLEDQFSELSDRFDALSAEHGIQEIWIRDVKQNWHVYRREADPPPGPIYPNR